MSEWDMSDQEREAIKALEKLIDEKLGALPPEYDQSGGGGGRRLRELHDQGQPEPDAPPGDRAKDAGGMDARGLPPPAVRRTWTCPRVNR